MITEGKFADRTVYYSGSIKGAPEADPDFGMKLIKHMTDNGAVVLSEHVAIAHKETRDVQMLKNMDADLAEIMKGPEPWKAVRRQDIRWVEKASHMVAVVNSPSHGVGIEIERAILKPRLGLNKTPILNLIHEDLISGLSFMVRGVWKDESDVYFLQTYTDLDSAISSVDKFLTREVQIK